MRTTHDPLGAVTAAFVADAALRRAAPPLRLDDGSRAWPLLDRNGDSLVLDEYGDLWWARVSRGVARVVREIWPEERLALAEEVTTALSRD